MKSLIEIRPSIDMIHDDFMPTSSYYDICDIYAIFSNFTSVNSDRTTYSYDLVEVSK